VVTKDPPNMDSVTLDFFNVPMGSEHSPLQWDIWNTIVSNGH
jgi:hypothetical protein